MYEMPYLSRSSAVVEWVISKDLVLIIIGKKYASWNKINETMECKRMELITIIILVNVA